MRTKGLGASLKKHSAKPAPLWQGPSGEGPDGGITQSMLGRYLTCKERFRVQYVEGWQQAPRFNHRMKYGSMWHVCEESHAAAPPDSRANSDGHSWQRSLGDYCRRLLAKYPFDRDDVEKWYHVCRMQFPLYIAYWAEHPPEQPSTPLLQEQVFDVPYKLPSGRAVRLRGKWDGVERVGGACNCGADRTGPSAEAHDRTCPACKGTSIWLREHKTKGEIDEPQIRRQLTFDLQTMLYLVALKEARVGYGENGYLLFGGTAPVVGVRYNVVRRPLSGGKGSIVQRKGSKNVPAETKEQYFARLAQYIKDEPETYFMRWEVAASSADVARFRCECLDPVLENLADDYEWWAWCQAQRLSPFDAVQRQAAHPYHCPRHFRMPFGIQSPLLDGGETDLDLYLATSSTAGLVRAERLFEELQ